MLRRKLATMATACAATSSVVMAPAHADKVDPPAGGFDWTTVAQVETPLAGPGRESCDLKLQKARYPAPDNRWIRYKWSVRCTTEVQQILFLEPFVARGNDQIFYRPNERCNYKSYCQVVATEKDPVGSQEYTMATGLTIAGPDGAEGIGKKFNQ